MPQADRIDTGVSLCGGSSIAMLLAVLQGHAVQMVAYGLMLLKLRYAGFRLPLAEFAVWLRVAIH